MEKMSMEEFQTNLQKLKNDFASFVNNTDVPLRKVELTYHGHVINGIINGGSITTEVSTYDVIDNERN